MLRDVRPVSARTAEFLGDTNTVAIMAFCACGALFFASARFASFTDLLVVLMALYFRWAFRRPFILTFKLPRYANMPDPE